MYPKASQGIIGVESSGSSGIFGVSTPGYTPYFFPHSIKVTLPEF